MNEKTIYLAGGCFWGCQKYFDLIPGVLETEVGYANGPTANPSYQQVKAHAGHAETVRVRYDADALPLEKLSPLLPLLEQVKALDNEPPSPKRTAALCSLLVQALAKVL